MKKLLSNNFADKLKKILSESINNEVNKAIIKKIDWETEAERCLLDLSVFFDSTTVVRLQNNDIDTIGVVDICWNEYGSDIEVDFMPNNDFEKAFDKGCIMNNSAIDNDEFFKTNFNVVGEDIFDKLGDDYNGVITIFSEIIMEIITTVAEQDEFKKLPLKSPCHFGFSLYHDAERFKILTV